MNLFIIIIVLFAFLWFIRTAKSVLFWIYLWQLKEYHIGRFIDHFRTFKGKKLIFNKLLFIKLLLVVFYLFGFLYYHYRLSQFLGLIFKYPIVLDDFDYFWGWFFFLSSFLIFFLYMIEAGYSILALIRRRVKRPILTIKTGLLIFFGIAMECQFIFIAWNFADYYLYQTRLLFGIVLAIAVLSFFLLLFDILTPLIISGIVLLFQPITVLARNRIIQKAKKKRAEFKDLLVIGITGSYGKTSTKEFLYTILSEKYNVLKTRNHQNSEIGIARSILNDLRPEHKIFIVEMGAYNRGGIRLLCDIVKPKIGILTGISDQHMATFGSQENIIQTKYELIESLPQNGLAIFNGDDPYCLRLYKKTKKPKKICLSSRLNSKQDVNPDVWADNIEINRTSLSFDVFLKDRSMSKFKVNLLGAYNISNILTTVSCAKELGMPLDEVARACRNIKSNDGAIKIFKTTNGINVVGSLYSSNSYGVIAALEYLKLWAGKKAIIMPCIIELGKNSSKIHRQIGKKIGNVCDLAIIVTRDCFADIKKSALEGRISKENVLFITDPKNIFERVKIFNNPDDIVFLEGRLPNDIVKLLVK